MNDNKKTIPSDKEEKITGAYNLLNTAKEKIPSLFVPEDFKTLLVVLSKFHRYSYINVILIYLQCCNAKYLASFKTWQTFCLNLWNDSERRVLKPEYIKNGIKLLAPYTRVLNRYERELVNYMVDVYDVSMTNDIPPLEQDKEFLASPKTNKLISALRYISPYRLIFAGNEDMLIQEGLPSYCDHNNQLIVLNEDIKDKKLLAEIVRAIAAAKLEIAGFNEKGLVDLITESTLFVFNQKFGQCVNSEINSFLFVERFQDYPSDKLANALFFLQHICYELIESLEVFLEETEEYDSYAQVDPEFYFDLVTETVK